MPDATALPAHLRYPGLGPDHTNGVGVYARPHPGILPQEKEKRSTVLNAIHPDRHTRDTLTNNRISHLDPLSPGERAKGEGER
jgi:hypothetical protein